MFECSSLALYERFERKQGLSSLLYLKCSTSSRKYIQQFFTSLKVATEDLKLINKLFTLSYMPSHPHLAGDSRIFVVSPALKIFTRFHTLESPAFCLMETKLRRQIFSQEEKRKIGHRSI